MIMPFDVEISDELDLEDLFSDVVVPDANMYIADENKAVELMHQRIFKNELKTRLINCFHFFQK